MGLLECCAPRYNASLAAKVGESASSAIWNSNTFNSVQPLSLVMQARFPDRPVNTGVCKRHQRLAD